ncbi:MAG: MFS transporter [Eubacteriales bacterium]|nr:MFS transporter [Eubacteriales bacterium]
METERKQLWTRDFSILTLGTVVSMFGNAVAGFAIGLLVLDKTDSVLLYALFMVCYGLPRIALPMFAGPFLDRFSRKRMIYSLDFISAGLFTLFFILLLNGFFNYTAYLFLSMLIGSIDSVYSVAYDSFYPLLISEGNYTRAYSVSSLIYPLSNAIMVPIAGICYKTIGLAPLFLFNAVTFLIAAIFETQIRAKEPHTERRAEERFDGAQFIRDLKDGFSYLRRERGLSAVTWFFFVMMLTGSLCVTLSLPYFKGLNGVDGVMQYTLVMGANTIGRLVGGGVHYFFRYPEEKKYTIALIVYVVISVIDGAYLYFPFWAMLIFMFLEGNLGVTSYNIRISSTQSYLPDAMRGRFNGLFQMLSILGTITGQLIAGLVGDVLPIRPVIAGAMAITLLSVFVIIVPNGEHVKKIYNVNA